MPVPCARCDSSLPVWELDFSSEAVCPACGARNRVRVFPALFAAPATPAPETALEGEAACFDHPSKRAVSACHRCGRFVCQLCAVESDGQVWCPTCVAAGKGQGKAVYLDPSRVLYDSIAFALPLAPLVFWPLTVITGPAAVVFSAITWKRPLSQVRRHRWRFVAAILIGSAETIGWAWLAIYFWEQFRRGLQ